MNIFRRFVLITLGMILGSSIGIIPYLNRIQAIEQRVQIFINGQIIIADIAKTPEQRAAGLSGRKEMNINNGMLFYFDTPQKQGFWMKGMNFGIDIIWIRDNKIVGTREYIPKPSEAESYKDSSLLTYYPPQDIDMALEVVAGRTRLLRAKVGDEIKVKTFLPKIE